MFRSLCVRTLCLCALTSWSSATDWWPEISLVPVSASGPHTIDRDLITMTGYGQFVFLEVHITNWDFNHNGIPELAAYQVSIDSSGYSSGPRGLLEPARVRCGSEANPDAFCRSTFGGICSVSGSACIVDSDCLFAPAETCEGSTCSYPTGSGGFCEPAFIHAGRDDYVFQSVTDLPVVDLSNQDFLFGSAVKNSDDAIADPGVTRYAGTLVLEVPYAYGLFTVGFNDLPETWLSDFDLIIDSVVLRQARIRVDCANETSCENLDDRCHDHLCQGGTCNSVPNYNPFWYCCNPATGQLDHINDDNECTNDGCNPDGTAIHEPKTPGTACNRGSNRECAYYECDHHGYCSRHDVDSGTPCGDPSDTDCTAPDTCDGFGRCQNNHEVGEETPCDDGLFCTVGDVCSNGVCNAGNARDCDDSIGCTHDSCDEVNDVCQYAPNNTQCDNGQWCDGPEICDPTLGCIVETGSIPDPDDGIECTVDSCDETNDVIVHLPDDSLCDDELFCNGVEFCDPLSGCNHSEFPCEGPCYELEDACSCQAPIVEAVGNRYLRIMPQPHNSTPQAIVVRPNCAGAAAMVACAPTSFDLDGDGIDDENIASAEYSCGHDDLFLTPSEWGELYVFGTHITPGTEYIVQGDCGSPFQPNMSDATVITTPIFGDGVGDGVGDTAGAPPNGIISVMDTVGVLDRFQGNLQAPPIYRVDHFGSELGECPPNQVIHVLDLLMVVEASKGIPYESATGCTRPCP